MLLLADVFLLYKDNSLWYGCMLKIVSIKCHPQILPACIDNMKSQFIPVHVIHAYNNFCRGMNNVNC